MKKIIISTGVVSILLFTVHSLFAQSLYIKARGGYGFELNSISARNSTYNSTTNSYSYTATKISYGKGLNTGIAIGYMLNDQLGFELAGDYLISGTSIVTSSSRDKEYSSKIIRIIPSLVVQTGTEGVNAYARLGPAIGLGGKIFINESWDDVEIKFIRNEELIGGLAIGFNAALGIIMPISNNLAFFAEANMISMSYAPSKGEIVKYTRNGSDLLSGMSTNEKETEYVDSYSGNNSDKDNPDEPQKDIKVNYPFSSIGANFGLQINF